MNLKKQTETHYVFYLGLMNLLIEKPLKLHKLIRFMMNDRDIIIKDQENQAMNRQIANKKIKGLKKSVRFMLC